LPPATTRAHHPALTHLLHHPKLNASRLALHLLHLDPMTPEAPNVFLNLARLFAPTRTLLLVPGTPKPPPPTSVLSLSIAHIRDPVIVRVAAPGHGTGITTSKGRLATPAVLSPMLILRDHPYLLPRVLSTGTRVYGKHSSRRSALPLQADPLCPGGGGMLNLSLLNSRCNRYPSR